MQPVFGQTMVASSLGIQLDVAKCHFKTQPPPEPSNSVIEYPSAVLRLDTAPSVLAAILVFIGISSIVDVVLCTSYFI